MPLSRIYDHLPWGMICARQVGTRGMLANETADFASPLYGQAVDEHTFRIAYSIIRMQLRCRARGAIPVRSM
jgi:hypothetical protein